MPGQDRTGPLGQGPMTGRGLGLCGGGMRRGFCGRGFGRGMGFRYARPTTLTEADEKKILESELKEVNLEKQEIESRLKELK